MNILFISRFLPHPEVRDSGGQDAYHYLAALSEKHSVTLIAFVTESQQEAADLMRQTCEEVVGVTYHPRALLPRIWRQWWRVWLPRVYGRNISLGYWRRLRELLRRKTFDVVVVDGMMAQYGTLAEGAKLVLDEIDVYSIVAYQIYLSKRSWLLRTWYWLDWLKTQLWEWHYLRLYDGVLVRSQADKSVLQSYMPDQNVTVVSPWFEGLEELSRLPTQRPPGNNLLFVGAMNLPANVEAVRFFVAEILPLIRQEISDVSFYIVGSNPTPAVQRLGAEKGVIIIGEVDDLTPYYEHSAVNVVPLLRGGGIIVKTLNGMAAGRPTVTTSVGNAGIGARSGRELLIADSPRDFADSVIRLLSESSIWHTVSESGRGYVQSRYTWADTIEALETALR